MASNPRKRPTPAANPGTPDATAAQVTTSPTDQLAAAFRAALDARDSTTGTIPAVDLDAVNVAYRAVPRRLRGDIVTALTAEATDRMLGDDGNVDVGLAQAVRQLTRAFATANASNGRERPPHDPVPETAGVLEALAATREYLLADLTDEQRARIDEATTTETAIAARDKALSKLASVAKHARYGANRPSNGNGERANGPGRNLAELVRASVSGLGEPVHLATIARQHGVSTGALGNRWAKDNIEGVKAVEVEGHKAFVGA
jgi:hypothetical protein